MSDTLALATQLTTLSAEELTRLITARGVRPAEIDDYFDLAEQLLGPDQVRRAVRALDRADLLVLLSVDTAPGPPADDVADWLAAHDRREPSAVIAELEHAGLLRATARGIHRYDAVTRELYAWRDADLPDPAALAAAPPPAPPHVSPTLDDDERGAAAALAATTHLADLVHCLDERGARELRRGGLSAHDAAALAESVGVPGARVPELLRLAEASRLVVLRDRRWQRGPAAREWLAASTARRWRHVVWAWHRALAPHVRAVVAHLARRDWAALADALAWQRPGAPDAAAQAARTVRDAELLGLVVAETPTQAGQLILAFGSAQNGALDAALDAAEQALDARLPVEADRLYVLPDLTLVATGPLRPELDERLRTIARAETHLPAATYRISRDTIRRAVGRGMSREEIMRVLDDASLNGVPQPLSYLIDDVTARDARLTVSDDARGGSRVDAAESHDLGPLLVDRSLAVLRLEALTARSAQSRLPASVVHEALIEAHYAAVLYVPPHRTARAHSPDPAPNDADQTDAVACARRLVAAVQAGTDHAQAWFARQLELAIRHRTAVTVTLRLPGGGTVVRTIEPVAIRRGRVRARERDSETERTFPLSHLESVTVAD